MSLSEARSLTVIMTPTSLAETVTLPVVSAVLARSSPSVIGAADSAFHFGKSKDRLASRERSACRHRGGQTTAARA